MTLIEILVVMAIVTLVTGGVVAGSGQLAGSRLRQSAAMVTGAIKVAYTRATATSKSVRLVFDFDTASIWLEEAKSPALVQSKDTTGTGGADPVTVAEQQAIEEGDRIIKGPRAPRPHFAPVSSGELGQSFDETAKKNTDEAPPEEQIKARETKLAKPLARGIRFREVQTAHDEAPRTSGRAYLYFWPGGQTERASVQIRIGDSTEASQTVSLMVSPLTGKVTIKSGSVAVPQPVDDRESSDREDRGFP